MLGLGHGVHSDTASLVEIFANRFSLAFNGTDEFVEINAVGNDITPGAKGTISMWVIMTATTGSATLIRGDVTADPITNEILYFGITHLTNLDLHSKVVVPVKKYNGMLLV